MTSRLFSAKPLSKPFLLGIWALIKNFCEISFKLQTSLFRKMHFKTSLAKWRPFRWSINMRIKCVLGPLYVQFPSPQWHPWPSLVLPRTPSWIMNMIPIEFITNISFGTFKRSNGWSCSHTAPVGGISVRFKVPVAYEKICFLNVPWRVWSFERVEIGIWVQIVWIFECLYLHRPYKYEQSHFLSAGGRTVNNTTPGWDLWQFIEFLSWLVQ